MTLFELEQQINQLEAKIAEVSAQDRLELQPKISRVLTTLQSGGQPIPRKLVQIDKFLRDEAFDDMFDNMPV